MLRSILQSSRNAYTCICVQRPLQKQMPFLTRAVVSSFHTSSNCLDRGDSTDGRKRTPPDWWLNKKRAAAPSWGSSPSRMSNRGREDLISIRKHRSDTRADDYFFDDDDDDFLREDILSYTPSSKSPRNRFKPHPKLPKRHEDLEEPMFADDTILDMLVAGKPYKTLPMIHIKSTKNNTIIGCVNGTGNKSYFMCSSGLEGFRNTKKGSNVGGQAAGLSAGLKAMQKGITHARVVVQGFGPGRVTAIRGIVMAGVKVVSITDRTRLFTHNYKPKKIRRV